MSNEGEKRCPLCAEEMDWTDRQFKPCKCGYQVCVWCWHHIIDMAEKDETEGRCPACRTVYEKDKIVATQANCERAVAKNCNRKSKPPKAKPKTNEGRKDLTNVRVIQRKMAYVIGLPLSLGDEDLLQRKEYFGQYGKISKISLSRTAGGTIQHFIHDTCSVYVTYSKEEEAVRCIQSVHGFVLEGRFLRASFGTAKYCHSWLRNMPCNNPTCLYLHSIGADEDSFGKDEVAAVHTRNRVQEVAGASSNVLRRSGNVLPPPVEELANNSGSLIEKSNVKSSLSDSAHSTHLAGGFRMPNRTTSFVDIVGRSSRSGPEKDENSAEDKRILDLCSDPSSFTIHKDDHVGNAYSSSKPYNVSSSGHLVSRLPMDRGSKDFSDEPFREDMMPLNDSLSKDSSNLCQTACVRHSSYPSKVSEDSGGHSLSHRRTHSSSSFSIDQSSVHSLEDEASLPITCVNSVLNEPRHELKFQTSAKSDRIYRSSNSFSNEEIVEHLRRIDDENLTNDDGNCDLDAVESSIISNIMSIDLDSCNDPLIFPHGLTDLLSETDDQHGSSWNSYTSGESEFSLAKRDSFAGQVANFEPSVNNLGQVSNNSSVKEHYLSKLQYQASKPPSFVPPGFSVPPREAPPGFSTYEKTGRFPHASSGTYINTSPLPYTLPAGNNGSNSDADFIDPAILSSGKSRPTNGPNFSGLNTRPASNQQMGAFDSETRLWLLMQQQATADQDSQNFMQQTTPVKREMRFPGHVGDELSTLNDVYGYSSRLMNQCQSYDSSSFTLLSQQKFGNGHVSNSYQHGLDEVQLKNELGFAELQRNEKLGLNKFFSGYGDLMFQMTGSGDVYTRVFGM